MKKIKWPAMPSTSQILWGAFSTLVLAYGFWLVSPFFKIEPADYLRAGKLALRLAGGLFIFMIYAGKWSFDIFAPQGLAKKVSGLKSAGLIIFDLLLVCFMIFIVAQAASLFLQNGIAQDEKNQNTITTNY
ncbi:MAG: hypothetical protein NTZ26_02560 [Candidatus Aminicenantes bacterium]|nr:hypothetical protein [Candidatus Aminicenantes bacterium]